MQPTRIQKTDTLGLLAFLALLVVAPFLVHILPVAGHASETQFTSFRDWAEAMNRQAAPIYSRVAMRDIPAGGRCMIGCEPYSDIKGLGSMLYSDLREDGFRQMMLALGYSLEGSAIVDSLARRYKTTWAPTTL